MPRLNRILLVLGVLGAFIPIALILPTRLLFDLMNAVAVSIGVGVVAAYFAGAWRWTKTSRSTGSNLLILGIMATWLAATGRLVGIWTWRGLGQPAGFLDHPIFAFGIYLFILGGALHLTASNETDNAIPPLNWLLLGLFVAVGVLLAFVLSGGFLSIAAALYR